LKRVRRRAVLCVVMVCVVWCGQAAMMLMMLPGKVQLDKG
jgi:hypothetical protein